MKGYRGRMVTSTPDDSTQATQQPANGWRTAFIALVLVVVVGIGGAIVWARVDAAGDRADRQRAMTCELMFPDTDSDAFWSCITD